MARYEVEIDLFEATGSLGHTELIVCECISTVITCDVYCTDVMTYTVVHNCISTEY